jgi:hypothetical protein
LPINNIRPVGDDQAWKAEVEKVISELRLQVEVLKKQVAARSGR